jgi:hypothetical protein
LLLLALSGAACQVPANHVRTLRLVADSPAAMAEAIRKADLSDPPDLLLLSYPTRAMAEVAYEGKDEAVRALLEADYWGTRGIKVDDGRFSVRFIGHIEEIAYVASSRSVTDDCEWLVEKLEAAGIPVAVAMSQGMYLYTSSRLVTAARELLQAKRAGGGWVAERR